MVVYVRGRGHYTSEEWRKLQRSWQDHNKRIPISPWQHRGWKRDSFELIDYYSEDQLRWSQSIKTTTPIGQWTPGERKRLWEKVNRWWRENDYHGFDRKVIAWVVKVMPYLHTCKWVPRGDGLWILAPYSPWYYEKHITEPVGKDYLRLLEARDADD